MLSAATLERVSASYRRGYYAGYAGDVSGDAKKPEHPFDRPFANFDYAEGFKAGANDRRCDDRQRAAALPAPANSHAHFG